MITQKRRFMYQPSVLTSCICWSWTLIVLLIGIIVWLEITHFQIYTLIIFIIFILLTWIQFYFRKIFVNGTELKIVSVLKPLGKKININEISDIKTARNRISFIARGKKYNFVLPANSLIEFNEIISKNKKE